MLTERLLSFANRLDATHQMAYLDPITQLPNSIAGEREMKRAIQQSQRTSEPFSIPFIDGDNLRFYNDISYSAGDKSCCQVQPNMTLLLLQNDCVLKWNRNRKHGKFRSRSQ
jgi:GGDEF domain-containing protein